MNLEEYQWDLDTAPQDYVYFEDDLDCAVDCFMKFFLDVVEPQAPIRKSKSKAKQSPQGLTNNYGKQYLSGMKPML